MKVAFQDRKISLRAPRHVTGERQHPGMVVRDEEVGQRGSRNQGRMINQDRYPDGESSENGHYKVETVVFAAH